MRIPIWLSTLLIALPFDCGNAQEWRQFRGPDSNPTSDNPDLPSVWSEEKNIEWSVDLPGRAWSSPIVTGGRIFLTTVITDGKSKPPETGTEYSNQYVAELMKQGLGQEEIQAKVQARDIELPSEVNVHFWLYCLDVETGETLWKDEFFSGNPKGGRHRKGSFASETPVTDGNHVYVYIANMGIFAYDLDGNLAWQTELKTHPIYLDFGTGSSPVLHDGRLILVHDNEEDAFVAAFDTSDGSEVWRTEREPPADAPPQLPKSAWVTPYVWQNELRTEIVTQRPGLAISYDLEGNELWRLEGTSAAPAASSFACGENLILNGGRRAPILSIAPGLQGTLKLDKDIADNKHIAWVAERAGTYIPSALAYSDGLYVLDDKGIMTKLNAETGEQVYKKRLSGKTANITSSPWAYNNRVFCLSEQGDTYVLDSGAEFKIEATNSLNDFTMATPAIVGNRLILRTEKKLYSIRNEESE
ncbi:MAG: PQQ-binding-like beta-propeller repeat protein [Planctomycetota bacterium]